MFLRYWQSARERDKPTERGRRIGDRDDESLKEGFVVEVGEMGGWSSGFKMARSGANARWVGVLLFCCCHCSLCASLRIIGDGRRSSTVSLQNDGMQCNNTIQGRDLLSDSRGYVCNIMAVNPATSCCPQSGEPFSCRGCNLVSQCCNSYEYCVACCLSPTRTAVEVALRTKLARHATAGTCSSLFDYCSGRCRHNSESVVHENAYVSGEHHCFHAKSNPTGEPVETSGEPNFRDLTILVGRQGQSCDAACKGGRLSCKRDKLASINTCAEFALRGSPTEGCTPSRCGVSPLRHPMQEELQKFNRCKGLCIASSGPDQPAEVVTTAPKHLVHVCTLLKPPSSHVKAHILTLAGFVHAADIDVHPVGGCKDCLLASDLCT